MIKLKEVIDLMEKELQKDPRREIVQGLEGPRDLLFTKRVIFWIEKLTSTPSEALLLAAWGHTLGRWNLSRQTYPMTTTGYHKWRKALAKLSADETEKILRASGHDESHDEANDDLIQKVRALILRTNFPEDPNSQILEDAECLAFLEIKFDQYIPEWDEAKTIRILKGTLEKMTPAAQALAMKMTHSSEAKRLLEMALI